jgi:hypothetical protein
MKIPPFRYDTVDTKGFYEAHSKYQKLVEQISVLPSVKNSNKGIIVGPFNTKKDAQQFVSTIQSGNISVLKNMRDTLSKRGLKIGSRTHLFGETFMFEVHIFLKEK